LADTVAVHINENAVAKCSARIIQVKYKQLLIAYFIWGHLPPVFYNIIVIVTQVYDCKAMHIWKCGIVRFNN